MGNIWAYFCKSNEVQQIVDDSSTKKKLPESPAINKTSTNIEIDAAKQVEMPAKGSKYKEYEVGFISQNASMNQMTGLVDVDERLPRFVNYPSPSQLKKEEDSTIG